MRATALWLVVASGSACHAVPASDRGAHGQHAYTAADATFSVEFLSPPWDVTLLEPERLELEVEAELFGVSLDGSLPTHVFQIGHVEDLNALDELAEFTELEELDTTTAAGVDTVGDFEDEHSGTTGDTDVGIPDYLVGVDLEDPYSVALAELNYLLFEQDAELDHEIAEFEVQAGVWAVEYQVQMSPGVFVRAFYVDARPTVVRATFASVFDLQTRDVETMARTVDTLGGRGA